MQDHEPALHRRLVRSSPARRSGRTWRPTTRRTDRPMPPDLAEQIPWVHEACEAMGVPILTSQRYEADDVIGTLAVKARAAGFDVAIVTGDKDFFQLVHDGIKVYNPRDDGTWFDAAGVKEKFGVRAGAGRRRPRPDGRLDRQHQGRSRHRREGGARSDRDVRHARGAAGARLRGAEQALPRRAARPRGRRAAEPRAGEDPDRRAGGRSTPTAVRTAARRASDASSCSRASASDAGHGVRADGRHRRQGIRRRATRSDGVAALAPTLRSSGRFAFRVLPDAPAAMRAGIAGLCVLDVAARQARYVPIATRRNRCGGLFGDRRTTPRAGMAWTCAAALDALRPLLEDASRRQGRTRPEVRRDRARAPRRDVARPRHRHDARELPARRDALVASARGARARARRLQGAARRGCLRPGREGGDVRAAAARQGARFRRRAGRSRAAALGHAAGSARRRRRSTRSTSELELPLIPVLVDIERAGVRIDDRTSCRRSRACRAGARSPRGARLRVGRRGVQHQLAEEALRGPVRQARLPDRDDPADDEDEGAVDSVGGAGGARADARAAAPRPGVARPAEAEGHLHRRAAAAGATRRPAACTPASTRRSRRRGA